MKGSTENSAKGLGKKARRKAGGEIARYGIRLCKKLKMQDWEVVVITDEKPDNPNAGMSIQMLNQQKLALLRFSDMHMRQPPWRKRYEMVHELTHLLLSPMDQLITDEDQKTRGGLQTIEWTTDAVAKRIAPHMPLPKY